jgi:hypothetical protein
MRYLLDTNIISDIAKPVPSESLLAWMSEQNDEDLFIASPTSEDSACVGGPPLLQALDCADRPIDRVE